MPPEITLSLRDPYRHHLRDVRVNAQRFTIGNSDDDDLPIADASLDAGQIVISTIGDAVWVEDNGARGGVAVNGEPLRRARELEHNDVVLLPGDYQLIVDLRLPGPEHAGESGEADWATNSSFAVPGSYQTANSYTHPTTQRQTHFRLTLIMAGLLAALIVFAVIYGKRPGLPTEPPGIVRKSPEPSRWSEPTSSAKPAENDILTTVQKVLRCNSGDAGRYVFPNHDDQDAVEERVRLYAGNPQAARALSALAEREQSIMELAQQSDLLRNHSALLVYMVLTETFARPASNPVDIAKQIQPGIRSRLRGFGTEKVDDILLVIATQRTTTNVDAIRYRLDERNVWELCRQKKLIGDAEREFLLDFLALSVIAQEPDKWKINAPALKIC